MRIILSAVQLTPSNVTRGMLKIIKRLGDLLIKRFLRRLPRQI